MEINSIITKEEYDKVKGLDYDIFSKYIIRLVKLCVEESLKSLPSVMTHLSSQAAYLSGLSAKFYKDNKDLDTKPNRKIMAQAIESIEGNNPGKSYPKILTLAAKDARNIISKVNQASEHGNIDLKQFDSHLGKL